MGDVVTGLPQEPESIVDLYTNLFLDDDEDNQLSDFRDFQFYGDDNLENEEERGGREVTFLTGIHLESSKRSSDKSCMVLQCEKV